jgi:hypothetical protein
MFETGFIDDAVCCVGASALGSGWPKVGVISLKIISDLSTARLMACRKEDLQAGRPTLP